MSYLVDTGAQFSVLMFFPGPRSTQTASTQSVSATPWKDSSLGMWHAPGMHLHFIHSLLIMLKTPTPLLGRDILSKAQVQILLPPGHSPTGIFPLQELQVDPAGGTDGHTVERAKTATQVPIHFNSPTCSPQQGQYPLRPEVREGLTPTVRGLSKQELLREAVSPQNTPMVGVRKRPT